MAMKLEDMRQRIQEGKSVLYKNRLITSLDKLPSAAELASTDEEKAAAAGDIDAKIAALQAQRASLSAGGKKDSSSETSSESGGGDDTLEELMKHTRAQLVEKAGEVGVEVGESDTKAEISQKILDANKAE